MRSLNEILLPTDFSLPCADVARHAAAVARHFNSKIALLHVLVPFNPAFAAFGSTAMLDEVLAHQEEGTCNSLNLYLRDEFRDLTVKRIVSEGDPAEIITSYCASEPVGLVMLRRLAKVTQQRSAEVPHTVDVIENGNEIRGSSSTLKACVAWD